MAQKRIKVIFSITLAAVILVITAFYFTLCAIFPNKYTDEINEAGERYGISADLIRAVIWTESKFDENAVSPKGACGLMQMMPSTRAEQSALSGITADGSAASEILLGTGYLSRMIEATGSEDVALMAYNAGLGSVRSWDKPYAESVQYVKRVKLARNIYKLLR